MKTLNDIISQVKRSLDNLSSPLANFTQFSNMYALVRSLGVVILQQYNDLESIKASTSLLTAIQEDLDTIGLNYSLYRNQGTFAEGKVLATSSIPLTLPQGVILNVANSSFQFETLAASSVSSSNTFIPLRSLSKSVGANLSVGTPLSSPLFPTVKFVVADSLDLLSVPIGGLTGGRDIETDESFRSRIINYLANLEKGTLGAIYNSLLELSISRFFIKESYPVPGYFTIYVDSKSQALLDQVEEKIISVKPIGIGFDIRPINSVYIDLRFSVKINDFALADFVSTEIKRICYAYFDALDMGEEIFPINLAVLCSQINGLLDIRLVDPLQTKIVPPQNSLLKLKNVYITLNTI